MPASTSTRSRFATRRSSHSSTTVRRSLAAITSIIETDLGALELEMMPDKAPETVRQFLRLAQAGIYDNTLVHRVAPGFVIQTGAVNFRQTPLTPAQMRLVRTQAPEFTDTPNEFGIVSMARGEDPASATTSFFVCIGQCRTLDGKYTVFARVTDGADGAGSNRECAGGRRDAAEAGAGDERAGRDTAKTRPESSCLRIRRPLIADTAHRTNQSPAVVLQRLAQPDDRVVHGAGRGKLLASPDLIENLRAIHDGWRRRRAGSSARARRGPEETCARRRARPPTAPPGRSCVRAACTTSGTRCVAST